MRWSDGEFRRWLAEPSRGSWMFLGFALGFCLVAIILTIAGC